ncbi:hypothetical protein MSAN_00236500 [Mycena sanguinolenta]|uniref:Cyanovirin-N domain-containing protein n=1 Tax=Mycena sanguinolenta TaxID=230812 RepID=A0A8H6ZHY1_9AGAR|nr:hypothetical protein MSAN_00236500 [Mycena sanguinolenta]
MQNVFMPHLPVSRGKKESNSMEVLQADGSTSPDVPTAFQYCGRNWRISSQTAGLHFQRLATRLYQSTLPKASNLLISQWIEMLANFPPIPLHGVEVVHLRPVVLGLPGVTSLRLSRISLPTVAHRNLRPRLRGSMNGRFVPLNRVAANGKPSRPQLLVVKMGGISIHFSERAVQQTNRYQESFERSTVGGEVVKSTDSYTNRVEIEEYLDRSLDSKTLADCILTLEDGVQLRIEWTSLDDKPANSILDLDKFIGNIDGRFVWGNGASGFSQSCNNPRLEGTFLVASCFYNGTYTEDRLNLDLYIIYSSAPSGDSGPGFGPVDSDFSEFMAAPNDWMNLTIITQPDMRTFLGHPRFQKVVSGVAHRAVGEAMVEMQYVMQQMAQQMVQQMVGEAMAMVRRRSTLHIEREMNQLVKTAAVHTAAYSNVDGFRLMQAGAIPPYNAFAAQIKAPLLSPESVED